MPEKPPCEMTSGGLPAKQSHNVSHKVPTIEWKILLKNQKRKSKYK